MAADDELITLKNNTNSALGEIAISPRVIEVIAGIAATKVDGVNRMRGNFSDNVKGFFGKNERGKGVKLFEGKNDDMDIDVYVFLNYGVSVPKVALQIQNQVRQQILFMTDLHVGAVNVHVEGIVPQKAPKVNTDSLFEEGEESGN